MTSAPLPNVFVVGAAKSGTTSLFYQLGQHPDVYMSPVKEPHFYADDLGLGVDDFLSRHPELFLPESPIDFWSGRMRSVQSGFHRDETAYRTLFVHARDEPVRAEASTSYLLSEHAAANIAHDVPDARIVIMLRHPVDVMHSLHAMLRLGRNEPYWEFTDAIEASRRRTLGTPPGHGVWTRYFEVIRFADQIRRYLQVFPRERIHVSLFDDLRRDPMGWLHGIHDFLGIERHTPRDVRPTNDSKVAWSDAIHRFLLRPTGRARALVSRIPEPVRVTAIRANMRAVRRDPLDPAMRASLVDELRPGIEDLADVIDRDLSDWID